MSALVEVFNSETHVFMAMDAVDGGDLQSELVREGHVDEARARGLFQQVGGSVYFREEPSGVYFCGGWMTLARLGSARIVQPPCVYTTTPARACVVYIALVCCCSI